MQHGIRTMSLENLSEFLRHCVEALLPTGRRKILSFTQERSFDSILVESFVVFGGPGAGDALGHGVRWISPYGENLA
jgi:hypothetical protein